MRRPRVIIVGAGSAGCSCAASLAGAGVDVCVVASALDVVGLPAYGPVLAAERFEQADPGDAVVAALKNVSPWIAYAWLEEAWVSSRPPLVLFDRRGVSLRIKWLLEGLPGLEFRQGVVTAISNELSGDGTTDVVGVRTDFGEVFHADGCVIAVGLGLGGRVQMGEQWLAGGRYGEGAADALRQALAEAGVDFRRAEVAVGPRYRLGPPEGFAAKSTPGGTGDDREGQLESILSRLEPLGAQKVALVRLEHSPETRVSSGNEDNRSCPGAFSDQLRRILSVAREEVASRVPLFVAGGLVRAVLPTQDSVMLPPSPRERSAGLSAIVINGGGVVRGRPAPLQGFFPDGVAEEEWYAALGLVGLLDGLESLSLTRLPYVARGDVVEGLEGAGRLPLTQGLWVAGQAAGARGYLESLVSGRRVADEVVEYLSERRRRNSPKPGRRGYRGGRLSGEAVGPAEYLQNTGQAECGTGAEQELSDRQELPGSGGRIARALQSKAQ